MKRRYGVTASKLDEPIKRTLVSSLFLLIFSLKWLLSAELSTGSVGELEER